MPILTSTDYPTIRNIMGVDITQVPDATLADFAHELAAEDWATDLVPNWVTIIAGGGTDAGNLRRAVAYYTAAMTADWLQQQLFERMKAGDLEFVRNRTVDWQALAIKWFNWAEEYINKISTRLLGVQGISLIAVGGPTSDGTNMLPNIVITEQNQ